MAQIEKIISGGQTGADRAALDFAIEHGIPHGGWCPAGRKSEDGPIDPRYELKETASSGYVQRTEWNVRDSDGTVVFSIAPALTGGSKKTVFLAHKLGKPVLRISRDGGPAEPDQALRRFIQEHSIKVLNVAGPRASKESGVYAFVKEVLATALLPGGERTPLRVLISKHEEAFTNAMRICVESIAHCPVTVLVPARSTDQAFLGFATAEEWDFAIVFSNALYYLSGDRSAEGLERDAAELVRTMVKIFKKPVIVVYIYPDMDSFPVTVSAAGAAAVLKAPCQFAQLKDAVQKCLPAVVPSR